MKNININDKIKVKLTDHGFAIWKDHEDEVWSLYPQLGKYVKSIDGYREKQDTEGYVTFQLWDFMHIFGPHCYMGSKPFLVDGLIRID